MIMAIDVDSVRDYVCKADRPLPKEEQTVWKIGVIDSVTMAKLDQLDVEFNPDSEEAKVKANLLGRELDYVRYGLKGFENFKDKSGAEIKPLINTIARAGESIQIISDKTLKRIPPDIIRELAAAIKNDNKLSDAEIKN